MTRGRHDAGMYIADFEGCAIGENLIELGAVGGQAVGHVKQHAEGFLHLGNTLADA